VEGLLPIIGDERGAIPVETYQQQTVRVTPVRSLELEAERRADAREDIVTCVLEIAGRMPSSLDHEPPLAGRELQDETTTHPVLVPADVGNELLS
jgi:hypothetical protein